MNGNLLSVQNAPEGSELAVYSCTGVPFKRLSVSGSAGLHLPRGIYLVALTSPEGTLTQKVLSR